MFTFFSIPKKFTGEFSLIQENAVLSWKSIQGAQVILLGDELGVSQFAIRHEIEHIRNISTNTHRTPLLSDAFQLVRNIAVNDILVYVNCDIIFTSSLFRTIELAKKYFDKYAIVGKRTDAFINEKIIYQNNWERYLLKLITNNSELHSKSGIDYFIFPKSVEITLPDFAVGRPSWDNWMIYNFLREQIPVIDSTELNLVVHQNHERGYAIYGTESKNNLYLAGGTINLCDISHSNYHIVKGNTNFIIRKNYLGILKYFYPVRFLFSLRLNLINIYLERIRRVK